MFLCSMLVFEAEVELIGVNPYVELPAAVLVELMQQAGKQKGPIPVRGVLHKGKMSAAFLQTVVLFSGLWRLYLNNPMRKGTNSDVGDHVKVELEFDPVPRDIAVPDLFVQALAQHPQQKQAFEALPAYRQKEIVRYLANLKQQETLEKNVAKVLDHLAGRARFAGRD